ncbi:MAG: UDP-N-acetylmuramate--L-alanine ligase [Patescibacteria group bacterium]|nr:UDP-N-acetylmuramate--L-alanine ligase [Patescibacteria group bacterium]
MKKIDFEKIKAVHFMGIGGIGVSALARKMLMDGKFVSGSDRTETGITKELRKIGADIFIGHRKSNLDQLAITGRRCCGVVIYSPAIANNNVELVEAKKMGIPALSYPEALGIISKDYYTIAVSGTDGKTTTTAMLAKVFEKADLDPTVVIGSLFKKRKSNFIAGKSKYFIIEACEYKRSFLNLHPKILVVTNINLDHLDYYKDLKDIQGAFRELVMKLGKKDYLVCNAKKPNIAPVIKGIKCRIVDYSDYFNSGLKLKIPGKHNLENAAVCLAVAALTGIDLKKARKTLGNFEGVWRRFEYKGKTKKGALVYDDYAHNPKEVRASLRGFREFFPNKKITVVFQPHLYSRTKFFLDNFAKSFNDADEIFIAPIYAAREKNDPSINSEMLGDKIGKFSKNVFCFNGFKGILARFKNNSIGCHYFCDAVIITMGAGDIYKIGEELVDSG